MSSENAIQLASFTEISTSIQIDSNENQLIYASQLYGTLFAVSGKFTLSPDKQKLKAIEFKLINYKGTLNLGLLSITRSDLIPDVTVEGRFNLTLQLKAMHGVHGHNKSLSLNDLDIDTNSFKQLLVTRRLHRFGPIENITEHLNDMVFDTEFFERDGAVIKEKNIHMDDAPIIKDDDSAVDLMTTKSGKCKTTLSNIIPVQS
jgi:hypothetical protein